MLPPDAIFKLKIPPKCVCAARGPNWGEITELLQTPSWFSGSRFAAREGKGRRRKRRRKREGG